MTTTTHASFVIERFYSASPRRVFAAWSDPAAKRSWFVEGEGWDIQSYEIDFREGGGEKSTFGFRRGEEVFGEQLDNQLADAVASRTAGGFVEKIAKELAARQRSRNPSPTARWIGLSRYSITRRCPTLISAVTFMPGLRRMGFPSTAMRLASSSRRAGKMAPRFSSLIASAVTEPTIAGTVP